MIVLLFLASPDYDRALKKPVCSRYGEGLFTKYPRKDGTVYNVNVSVGLLAKCFFGRRRVTLYVTRLADHIITIFEKLGCVQFFPLW